jgi:hypothetical protein
MNNGKKSRKIGVAPWVYTSGIGDLGGETRKYFDHEASESIEVRRPRAPVKEEASRSGGGRGQWRI